MPEAVFDTTVFIDAYYRHPSALSLVDAASRGQLAGAYSPIAAYELWLRLMTRTEEIFHRSVLAILEELPFTASDALQVAAWLRDLPRAQRLAPAGDAIVAAAAARNRAAVYTRNPRDFARFYDNVQSY
jgi:predicted nucleic acid-binding protein